METLSPGLLEKLLEKSRLMAETRELNPLLHDSIRFILELLDAENGFLVLLNDDDTFDFRVKLRYDGAEVEAPSAAISWSILKRAIFDGEDVLLADAVTSTDYHRADSVRSLQLHSVMCVPLVTRETTLGALYIDNRSQTEVFNDDDLKLLKFFAGQAAVAIQNAILNDELEARVAARTAELEAANRQLQENWQQAVEFNRVRTSFLSTIVHDIRSPLSTVLGSLMLFDDETLGEMNEQQHEWIDTIIQTTRHVIRLTDDFFDLTKLDLDRLVIYPEPVELESFLNKIYDVGQILPWNQDVAFELDLADDLPTLSLDSTRIQQVLLNLLSNAAKFTESGAVTLYAYPLEDGVRMGVRDTGVGIQPEEVETIFTRFAQAGPRQSRKQGTGLGLSISQALINLHESQIQVESEPDAGSDFYFVLPYTLESE